MPAVVGGHGNPQRAAAPGQSPAVVGLYVATGLAVSGSVTSDGFPDGTDTGYLRSGISGEGGGAFGGSLTPHAAGFSPEPAGGRLQTANQTYTHLDFDGGTTYIEAANCVFNGCRFRGDFTNVGSETDLVLVKAQNCTFNYCTFEGTAAPSGDQVADPNGYRTAINSLSGGGVYVNHCDISGFGCAVSFNASSQSLPVEMRNCWLHDLSVPCEGNHTNGIADADNHAGTDAYVVIDHNTMDCKYATSQNIGFQSGVAAGFDHCTITRNWFAGGTSYTLAEMHLWSNFTITDNVFSTKHYASCGEFGPLYSTSWIAGTNTTWRRNTWEVTAGSRGTPADNGLFLWPDGSLNTSDYTG